MTEILGINSTVTISVKKLINITKYSVSIAMFSGIGDLTYATQVKK